MEQALDKVSTIGYQGKTISGFVQELVDSHVEILVDVRRKAISRKPGFSKTRLRDELEAAGIEYHHLPDLGMPTDLMSRRNLTDNSEILQEYEKQLVDHSELIKSLADRASTQSVCLLCFEADHNLCHRAVLASYLVEEAGFEVDHL